MTSKVFPLNSTRKRSLWVSVGIDTVYKSSLVKGIGIFDRS